MWQLSMPDKAAELSVWEVLLVLAYSMMKQIVKQYKRRILIYRYSFLLWKNIKMTLLIKRLPFKCSFFKSIKVMGSSSVFTHCVLNYAISMSNLPCSKWVGIWAWFTTRKILEMIWRDSAKLNKLDALQLFYSKLQL